jgi:hypothetical protein
VGLGDEPVSDFEFEELGLDLLLDLGELVGALTVEPEVDFEFGPFVAHVDVLVDEADPADQLAEGEGLVDEGEDDVLVDAAEAEVGVAGDQAEGDPAEVARRLPLGLNALPEEGDGVDLDLPLAHPVQGVLGGRGVGEVKEKVVKRVEGRVVPDVLELVQRAEGQHPCRLEVRLSDLARLVVLVDGPPRLQQVNILHYGGLRAGGAGGQHHKLDRRAAVKAQGR